MLHCSACIRVFIRTVLSDLCNPPFPLTSSPPHILPTRRVIRPSTCFRRGYNVEASAARDVRGSAPAKLPRNRVARSNDVQTYPKSHLKLELRWLKDSVRLADHTVKLLKKDDFLKALELVRLASKDVECTVSWNHLIDYEMSKGRVIEAIKLYNEMKKRAKRPDSYTFTILFRGLSWRPHNFKSPARALSIYQSMFAENSPVRPSIIHTNAVVNVCARAHDIDALLGIAADLPVSGSGAPDKLTFTIILNAIQSNASGESQKQKAASREEDAERNEKIALAVQQGRRLWWDIRQRWKRGDLAIDEDLVCAMGRLLLLGNEAQDKDDILSLLEQTMGLSRQIARLADPAPERAGKASGPKGDSELSPNLQSNAKPETLRSPPKEQKGYPDPFSDTFTPPSSTTGLIQSTVRPSRNTLSLVLDACISLKYVRAAQNYWGLLTSPDGRYKIGPDGENYHMYLRLLRVQRASKLAVELVDEMRSGKLTGNARDVQAKTFRIALSCCLRDIKNKHSLVHAGKLVRMMTDTLSHPDAKALSMYLKLALGQEPQDWRIIMGVIRGTELGVRNLRSLIAYEPAFYQKQAQDDIEELVKQLIGAYDVVLNLGNEEITSEEKRKCKELRFALESFLTRKHTKYMSIAVNRKDSKGTTVKDQDMRGKPITLGRRRMLENRSPP